MVLLLGEIDCREGLLLAVQKCKVCGRGVGQEGRQIDNSCVVL